MSAQPPKMPPNVLVMGSGAPVVPAQTVTVAVRPFWRDPGFLAAVGLFLYLLADNLQGKDFNRTNVVAAVIAAVVAFGRLLAPYVRSFVPWFDKGLPAAPPGPKS